ncbi:DUF1015 family protein [Eubacterium oxidoreducens]|uniref:Uncharacterized protein n=1 Tax=Eubacterium oxidoreducens TaxID=1732 RepID=A0A1G6AGA9_EUBOX|nr:DUF1015 family protein [Eubacterium oxidoreducens]SDB07429.1 Protein of unknown function [Eubacterium oxidoreducens]
MANMIPFSAIRPAKDDVEIAATWGASEVEVKLKEGKLKQVDDPAYYVYRMVAKYKTYVAVIAAADVKEYVSHVIKGHQDSDQSACAKLTAEIKDTKVQTVPAIIAYKDQDYIKTMENKYQLDKEPLYDFTVNGVQHTVYEVDNSAQRANYEDAFAGTTDYTIVGNEEAASAAAEAGCDKFLAMLIPYGQIEEGDMPPYFDGLFRMFTDERAAKKWDRFSSRDGFVDCELEENVAMMTLDNVKEFGMIPPSNGVKDSTVIVYKDSELPTK